MLQCQLSRCIMHVALSQQPHDSHLGTSSAWIRRVCSRCRATPLALVSSPRLSEEDREIALVHGVMMAPQGSPVSFLARAEEGKVCVVSRTGIGGGARVPSAWTLLSEGSSLPVADERSNMFVRDLWPKVDDIENRNNVSKSFKRDQ